ncbi:MAG: lytic murein transglycosylase [Burkholderiaceae bacterium]
MPAPTPSARMPRLLICIAVVTALADARAAEPSAADLPACLARLRGGARANGVSLADYDRLARSIRWQAKTVDASRSQPEVLLTWKAYLDRVLTPARVARGQQIFTRWRTQAEAVARRYGSDAEVITAIWGVESDFGTRMGTFPVLDAWATLACLKPSDLRVNNFYGSMRLLAANRVPADRFTGSWSGAFGLTQFIPTSFEAYAADGDDDGAIDLYTSVPDAMASTARHLAERTYWTRGVPAAIEVTMPPALLQALTGGATGETWIKAARPLATWAQQGVVRADGSSLLAGAIAPTKSWQALLTEGARGRSFLLSSNFDALTSYNKSTKYAIAVSLLARAVQAAAPSPAMSGPVSPPRPAAPAISASPPASAEPIDPAAAVAPVAPALSAAAAASASSTAASSTAGDPPAPSASPAPSSSAASAAAVAASTASAAN